MVTEARTIATEITEQILEYATLPPERKRDGGSSMISTLDQNLRHGVVMIIDLMDLRPKKLEFGSSKCPQCGERLQIGETGWYAQQASGVGIGPFHKTCVKRN